MATATGVDNLKDIGSGLPPRNAATIVSLTDSTTGTATDTLDATTADVKDDLASLAAKIEEILVLLQNCGLRN
jgi:hypothetical protein